MAGLARRTARVASKTLVGAPVEALIGRRSARHPMSWVGGLILLAVLPIPVGWVAAAWPAAWWLPFAVALLGVLVLTRLAGQLLGGIRRPIVQGLRSVASLTGAFVALVVLGVGALVIWWLLSRGLAWLLAPALGVCLLLALLTAAAGGRRRDRGARKREELFATIFGGSASAWEGRTRRLRDGSVVAVAPGAALVAIEQHAGDIDGRVVAYRADLEASRLSQNQILLSKARPETRERRRLAATSEGRVLAVALCEGGQWELSLAALRAADAGALALWCEKHLAGAVLTRLDLDARTAAAGPLDAQTRRVRDAVAGAIGAQPHEVEVSVDVDDEGVKAVDVVRFPSMRARDGETVTTLWRRVLESSIKEAHPDWVVQVDRVGDTVRWERRPMRVLPALVPLQAILPERYAPQSWSKIPIGLGSSGLISVNLKLGPHALIQGETGTGKSITLLAHLVSALSRGHDAVVIDPVKEALDYLPLRPWLRGIAETYEESEALILAVYAEGVRRKPFLKAHGVVKFSDLPEDVRERERIRPLTVLVDEFHSIREQESIPKGLDRDDPDVVSAQALNRAKARVEVTTQKIARELRSVGVHLVVATQDANAEALGGRAFRKNLASATAMVVPGRDPDPISLKFMFQDVAHVQREMARFDDGHSLGLAITAGEGGDGPTAVRIGHTEVADVPAVLDGLGVPRAGDEHQFDLTSAASPTAAAPAFGRIIEQLTEQVVDAGVIELGEINFDDEPEAETPQPAKPAGALSFGLDLS